MSEIQLPATIEPDTRREPLIPIGYVIAGAAVTLIVGALFVVLLVYLANNYADTILVVRDIFNIIERLRAEGTSILLIEQNARAALAVSDHGYVLETGAIVLDGAAAALAEDPRVIETYLGAQRG